MLRKQSNKLNRLQDFSNFPLALLDRTREPTITQQQKTPVFVNKFWNQLKFLGNWSPTHPVSHNFAPSEK